MSKTRQRLFKIIMTAILIALNVVLERIVPSYKIQSQDISFGFVAVAFAASFLGIPYAIAVAGFGDLLGSLLFPFGAYFPGFTATNCIFGLILAVFLYKRATILNIALAVILNKAICSLILNTIWISVLYRGGLDAFWVVLLGRLPGVAILAVVELVIFILVFWNKSKIRLQLQKAISKFI